MLLSPAHRTTGEKNNLPRISSNLSEHCNNIDDNEDFPTKPAAPTSAPTKYPQPQKNNTKKPAPLSALIKKTDPRRKIQRTQSLMVETTTVMRPDVAAAAEPASPIAETDIGPWSTEAFDLFDWRPPKR